MKASWKTVSLLSAALLGASSAVAEIALNNPYNVYQSYGNVNVYSLPYQSLIYEKLFGSADAYKVMSTPGAIKDQVVIYTGAEGGDVTTNVSGFDDAYLAPNGVKAPFATTSGINTTVPTAKAEIANSSDNTWDASLLAMKSFLQGGDAYFMFNNNDTNEDQNLAIWAKIWVTDETNALYGRYLYLSNMGQLYGFQPLPGGDASAYNPGNLSDPLVSGTGNTDYVMSGGNVCFDGTTLAPEVCDGDSIKVNHNLGANEVAYTGVIPVLEGYFDDLFIKSDLELAGYTLHIDLRLGCDPRWGETCDSIKIDNGFEQLWLMAGNVPHRVPEPGVLAMIALGLLGLAATRRTRAATA